jgi:concentrative nucleoside transporter, CNT family
MVVLRWEFGKMLFKFLSEEVVEFFGFADHGSSFVFGDSFKDHYFAFKVTNYC